MFRSRELQKKHFCKELERYQVILSKSQNDKNERIRELESEIARLNASIISSSIDWTEIGNIINEPNDEAEAEIAELRKSATNEYKLRCSLIDMLRELTDYKGKANEIFVRLVKAGIRMPELQEITSDAELKRQRDHLEDMALKIKEIKRG